jgi:hypothetical protein
VPKLTLTENDQAGGPKEMQQRHFAQSFVTVRRPLSAAFFMFALGVAVAATAGCSTSNGDGQSPQGGS